MLDKKDWRDFFAVSFSIAIVGIGLGCTLPLTALVLTSHGFGPDVVGWMIAAAALGGVVGTFVTPAVVARFGRRSTMIACFVVGTASIMPLQFTMSLELWMLLRFLFGLSMAALFLIGEAWINILPEEAVRGRIVAIYTTSFTAFQVAGPLFTDWISGFPHSSFLICGALFMLGVPGMMFASDDHKLGAARSDSDQASHKSGDRQSSWLDIAGRAPAIIAGTAFFASFDCIILGFLPLFAIDSGFSQTRALAAPAIVLAGDATLQYAAGWLSDHYGRERVHRLFGLMVCVMLPLLPLVVHLPVVWEIYLFVLGGFAGAVYTLSMVASGTIFSGSALLRIAGLIGLTWNISSSAGPAATGLLMQRFGSPAMIAVLWCLALVFLISSNRIVKRVPASS